MIVFKQSGDLKKTTKFLKRMSNKNFVKILDKYGARGVDALASATPVDTGKTAGSWAYNIVNTGGSYVLEFTNSNVNKGVVIAIILQYGHGTRGGGYVSGVDYINPAIRPIFDAIANEAWKEVTTE